MIKIFNYLPDRYGFKPTRIVGGVQGGSEWYTPPLAFGLVCKYFLNVRLFLIFLFSRSLGESADT